MSTREMTPANNSASTGPPAGYTAAVIVYVCYLLAPLTVGLLWLAGLFVALVSKKDAAPTIDEHLNHAVKLGISGLIGYIIAIIIAIVLFISIVGIIIAWLPLLVWWIWSLIKCVRGLDALTSGKTPPG